MKRQLPRTIAIDGPAASGKTTVGLAIAGKYGYRFLDTGLMYRAVTLAALRAGVAPDNAAIQPLITGLALRVEASESGTRIYLGEEDVTARLRDPAVEANVSQYSALPKVREAMVREQRKFARAGRAVLAGRDIGTVVLPQAGLKLYLDASEEARARRRGAQQEQRTHRARKDIAGRDRIDSTRTVSPLKVAEDAPVVDTTTMKLDEVIKLVLETVQCSRD